MKPLLLVFLCVCAVTENAQPQAASPRHPSFQLTAQAKRALVEKAITIKQGDAYQTVTNKLGVPTYDQDLTKKDGHVVGRSLKYYVVIWEAGLVSELYDELVDVFLDERNHVRSVSIRVTLE